MRVFDVAEVGALDAMPWWLWLLVPFVLLMTVRKGALAMIIGIIAGTFVMGIHYTITDSVIADAQAMLAAGEGLTSEGAFESAETVDLLFLPTSGQVSVSGNFYNLPGGLYGAGFVGMFDDLSPGQQVRVQIHEGVLLTMEKI